MTRCLPSLHSFFSLTETEGCYRDQEGPDNKPCLPASLSRGVVNAMQGGVLGGVSWKKFAKMLMQPGTFGPFLQLISFCLEHGHNRWSFSSLTAP